MNPSPRRVRDERRRANAEHLRGREDDEGEIAADADCRHCRGAQTADPVQIDKDVKRLKDHADQHEAGRSQKMPGQRSRGEILHSRLAFGA